MAQDENFREAQAFVTSLIDSLKGHGATTAETPSTERSDVLLANGVNSIEIKVNIGGEKGVTLEVAVSSFAPAFDPVAQRLTIPMLGWPPPPPPPPTSQTPSTSNDAPTKS